MKKALLITGGLVAVYVVVRNRKLITDKATEAIKALTERIDLYATQIALRNSEVGYEVDNFGDIRSRPTFNQ